MKDLQIVPIPSETDDDDENNALNLLPIQLHFAQQEINNLRILNVCLQSTLFRVQTHLTELAPIRSEEEIRRNQTKQKLNSLRRFDDNSRQRIDNQQLSFIEFADHFKRLFSNRQQEQIIKEENTSSSPTQMLSKCEKQIDLLHGMFHELNTIISTEHNDRISQLYITLAQASHSVVMAREMLDTTVHAHRIIARKTIKQQVFFLCIGILLLFVLILFIVLLMGKRYFECLLVNLYSIEICFPIHSLLMTDCSNLILILQTYRISTLSNVHCYIVQEEKMLLGGFFL